MELLRVVAHAIRPNAPRIEPDMRIERWLIDSAGGGGALDLYAIGLTVKRITGVHISNEDWRTLTGRSQLNLDILFLHGCSDDFTFARLADWIARRRATESTPPDQQDVTRSVSEDAFHVVTQFIHALHPSIRPFTSSTALGERLSPGELSHAWELLNFRLPGRVPRLPRFMPPRMFGLSIYVWGWIVGGAVGFGGFMILVLIIEGFSVENIVRAVEPTIFFGGILTVILGAIFTLLIGGALAMTRRLRGTARITPAGVATFGDLAELIAGLRDGWCEACGYDLTGATSGRCPECGRSIVREPSAA